MLLTAKYLQEYTVVVQYQLTQVLLGTVTKHDSNNNNDNNNNDNLII